MATPAVLILLTLAAATLTPRVAMSRVTRSDKVYKVTTIAEPPYVIIDDNLERNTFRGFVPDLMEQLSDKLDIQYELQQVKDGRYGEEKAGTWNGMIGEIITQKVDMAAAPITITERRSQVVDFTEPFMSITTTFLTVKPSIGEKVPFKSAEDLVKQSNIKYGVVKDGTTANFFKTSTNPTYQQMWEKMQDDQSVFVQSNQEGVDRVRSEKGNFVFIIESSTADYWINKTPCDLMKVSKIEGNTNNYGLVVPKGSQLKSRLNTAILALSEQGVLEELKRKWWQGDCSATSGGAASVAATGVACVASIAMTMTVLL